MSTSLTYSPQASLPEHDADGLLITFTQGSGDAHLPHELAADADVLHARFMLAPATAVGGSVQLAGGSDAAENETWHLTFDADQRLVQLKLATGHDITATLNALPWHCIEVRIDALGDMAHLWVNGLECGNVTGDFSPLASRSLWRGGRSKDANLVGTLYLDAWAVDDQHIGPVVIKPTSDYADDPRRWLVVYNAAVPDAVTWAQAYREARQVPFANLLGLTLPMQETIDGNAYASLANAIGDYLSETGLDQQVMGILSGFGVPGYVDFGFGVVEAVPALLHSSHLDDRFVGNPLAHHDSLTRPRFDDLAGHRMTARIDGHTLADALTLIDRADNLIALGLGDGENATLWLDPYAAAPGSGYAWWTQQMVTWATSYARQRLRLPFEISADPTNPPPAAVQFPSINNDGFFWGWPAPEAPAPPAGFFAQPAGRRVCCVQLHVFDATATTLRSPAPTNWVDTALAAGYAAAVGTSREFSLTNTPFVQPFFEALRRGWTLAEAWYVSLPILREGLHLVGDPLLRTKFPAKGWDIYGPAGQLEHLDVTTPAVALRHDTTSLALTDADMLPPPNDEAAYLVRHVDEQGRPEAGLAVIRLARDGTGTLRQPAMPPTWPMHEGWQPGVRQGAVHLALAWERPIRLTRVHTINLLAEVDGQPEAVVFTATVANAAPPSPPAEPPPTPLAHHVCTAETTQPLPVQQARYRWQYISDDGLVCYTPRSAVIRPQPIGEQTLNVLEARP